MKSIAIVIQILHGSFKIKVLPCYLFIFSFQLGGDRGLQLWDVSLWPLVAFGHSQRAFGDFSPVAKF